ncbi:ABC transporter permease [Paenibacillus endoradicis]|uniref:ABC transporter permease n=1 Tax=Paenibacillus endoradicis TaxID=2972487 RepID=UPI002158F821|nr:ABC transporter permease [Paenibacillus endoradicis]MCR8659445.1 ABC transporter permease [Paenibacillus endoradicis]
MTFRSLALKNVKENWRSYSAFFLSSVFSVAIFYIYIAFIQHPDVTSGYIAAASKVKSGMKFCLYIIAMFSFIFILYSSTSFLKTRKKEFGLFSLFGMTKRQLRKLVFIENMVIGVLSTGVGIAVGILCSKLFFLALGSLLHLKENISFAIPLSAVVVTVSIFVGIFFVITLYATLRMGKGQIIDLLHAHKKPKGQLKYSMWQVILGAICIVGGYGLAATMTIETFIVVALPVVILVVAGTYFLYSQLSIVFLQLLKKNRNLYYNKSNMLIIGQLGYKIKDNARILFTITILSAVVMTAMGTIYIMQLLGKEQYGYGRPYSIAWTEQKNDANPVTTEAYMEEVVEQSKHLIEKKATMEGLLLRNFSLAFHNSNVILGSREESERFYDAIMIPLSTYNQYASKENQIKDLDENELAAVNISVSYIDSHEAKLVGQINGETIEYEITKMNEETLMNNHAIQYRETIVVPDELYSTWDQQSTDQDRIVFHGIEISNWKKALPLVEKIQADTNDTDEKLDMNKIIYYVEYTQTMSLTIFIGLFISLLFFIAAGSLIYFKLFTERDEDITMFKSLSRIGVTYKEMRKVVITQIGIIFFLPCVVGISHALFAMFALDSILESSNWIYSFVVFGIYIVMQGIYFLFASRSYLSSIRKGSITVTN